MSDKKSENLNELEMKDEPKAVSNEEPKVDPETELKEVKYKKKHYSVKDRLHEAAFLSPSFLGVLTFFVVPFFVVIYYANIDSIIQKNFVGIENFKNVLQNSSFQTAAKNTAVFSATAVPLAIVLSLIMALILEQNIPMKSQFRTFFLSPLMVPVASVVLIWQVLFDYHGMVNKIINVFGGGSIDWLKSAYAPIVIVILFLWKNLGYNMILFMAALSSIPRDVIEVSMLDGATPWRQFWSIKIRYLLPTILFVGIMSLINSFKVFREVYLLAGDYPYDSIYTLQHFMNNTFRSLDYQKLSAAAIIMFIVITVIVGILFFIEERAGRDLEGQ